MNYLFLTDIIKRAGINPKEVKLIRHALSHKKCKKYYDEGKIKEYTQHQRKGFSDGYKYWMVFISDGGELARLEGFYKVLNEVPDIPENKPEGSLDIEQFDGKASIFTIEKLDTFNAYEGKMIIEWGKSARSWAQKGTTEKPIVAIQTNSLKIFEGFEKLILTYDELKEIVEGVNIYENWHTALSSVYAVYLITDTEGGMQYIGSAYGKSGLLGRWSEYVKTKHGNNKKIIKMLEEYPNRYRKFQYSVLQILPKNLSEEEVIDVEKLWKDKLHTREFGLNDN
ncbi:MAG: GIY-YIG nuclease family protein [Lachnospiraceae bacterium]|nr:GIY-YIG nuclease family protein [Lachnospiraceae bacterium]